jgi:ribonuclease P protein component
MASPPAPVAVGRLTRRPEFLSVAASRRKCATQGLILQARAHEDPAKSAGVELRYGLTASRKVGNAVARNRARRRLRAAVAELFGAHAAPGHDYVLVARTATVGRPWSDLKSDIEHALRRLGLWRPGPGGPT